MDERANTRGTALIKRRDDDAIAALDWRPFHDNADDVTPPVDPLLVALKREVEELREALTSTEIRHADAVEAAYAKGGEDAQLAQARSDEKALAALEAGIAAEVRKLDTRIKALDGLALLLCQTALAKIFANAATYETLVTHAIRLQISGLRRESIVDVAVSAADFPDAESLQRLANRIGHTEIVQDAPLIAGECRIELRLGAIELSLARHWDELQALFKRLGSVS